MKNILKFSDSQICPKSVVLSHDCELETHEPNHVCVSFRSTEYFTVANTERSRDFTSNVIFARL